MIGPWVGPGWLVWVDLTWPFLHYRRGTKL